MSLFDGMHANEFLLLAGAHFLALLSPGPDFLLLVRNALRYGRWNGIGVSAGIASANGAYILAAIAGFSLVQQGGLLLNVLKWLACLYLAYIGWCFLQSARTPLPELCGDRVARANGRSVEPAQGFMPGFAAGFLSGGLNPKNGIFYFGLFTLMVGADTGPLLKSLYGVWMFGAVLLWDAALVLAVSHARVVRWMARYLPAVERSAGILLLGAAAAGAWMLLPW
ncbi:LysE family translocator [Herbaspirillum lusitanum]|uniref:LysE family translocator n=1 Tax=Herbaspirillum lusitanum TaxID=213312 RepID=A0ABW9AFK5_9BURK